VLDRRKFIGAAVAGAAATGLNAQQGGEWGSPVLDIHLHFKQDDRNFAHIEGCGVTTANLLTPANSDALAQEAISKHSGRFVRFTTANIAQPQGIGQMRACVKDGALGLGEIKFRFGVDSREMRSVYELAAELNVPVTIHFEEDTSGEFTAPLKGLPAMIKAYPKTRFIGHANAFWANISADTPPGVAYPAGRIKPGGLTDKMLSESSNLYADMSVNSGRNALARDPDFAAAFIERHRDKLMFGSDCPCEDGHGTGQVSQEPLIKNKCVARETLTALKQLTSRDIFRKVTWENAYRVLKLSP
jgi:predicted TIM-barrel fold metal-dependent hydrolase